MDRLQSLIRGEIGGTLFSFETIDSTNTVAMELGEKGASHGTVVIADAQTKGRGRLGRVWVSPPGVNIYMSVLFRTPLDVRHGGLLTIMAGVACCLALRDAARLPVLLKWPNDLIVRDKKLGGILTESKTASGKILFAVIGIGIDVNMRIEGSPPEIREIATSLLHETSQRHSRTTITAAVLNELDRWCGVLTSGNHSRIIEEWKSNSSMLGKAVSVAEGRQVLQGVAEDITEEGMLLLRLPSGRVKAVSTGDVTVLG